MTPRYYHVNAKLLSRDQNVLKTTPNYQIGGGLLFVPATVATFDYSVRIVTLLSKIRWCPDCWSNILGIRGRFLEISDLVDLAYKSRKMRVVKWSVLSG